MLTLTGGMSFFPNFYGLGADDVENFKVLWCKQVLRLIESRWEGAQPAIGRDRVGKSIGTTLRVSVGTYLPSIPSAVYPIRS
jgi:hypothetical protein